MSEAEELRAQIVSRFDGLRDRVRLQRERRLWVEVGLTEFRPLFDLITDELGFDHLATISGTDEGEELGVLYHLARPSGVVLSLMTRVARGAAVPSVGDRFPGAVIYERELKDLFGANIVGLPPGPRYPLPDDWPAGDYPLLKGWRREAGTAPDAEASPTSDTPAAASAPSGGALPDEPRTAAKESPHG